MMRLSALLLATLVCAQEPAAPVRPVPSTPPAGGTSAPEAAPIPAVDPRVDEWASDLANRLTDANPDIARSARVALMALGPRAEPTLQRLSAGGATDAARAAQRALEDIRLGPPPMRRMGPGGLDGRGPDGPRRPGMGGPDGGPRGPMPRDGERPRDRRNGPSPEGPRGAGPRPGERGPMGPAPRDGGRPRDGFGPREGAGPRDGSGPRNDGAPRLGPGPREGAGPERGGPPRREDDTPPQGGRRPPRDGDN